MTLESGLLFMGHLYVVLHAVACCLNSHCYHAYCSQEGYCLMQWMSLL